MTPDDGNNGDGNNGEQATSGKIGALTWKLEDGTLTITGAGAMPAADWDEAPWGNEVTKVVIGGGVTEIGESAFKYQQKLTTVQLANTVTKIGEDAFYNCQALTTINLPGSLTEISAYAFYNCKALTTVNLPGSLTKIGARAFHSSGLTRIDIPSGVKTISEGVFGNFGKFP